ncbi:MAG: tetratricopeptide repeat protein [Alphaproteobacteria bacterium]|nr:tetratricopeptide repeat protein [Alphaproteobacteria bacterium]
MYQYLSSLFMAALILLHSLCSLYCQSSPHNQRPDPNTDRLSASCIPSHNSYIRFETVSEPEDMMKANVLAIRYIYGIGLTQDCVKGLEILFDAASRGSASAQSNLGVCFANGWGVTQDYAKAAIFFAKAAQYQHRIALYNLYILLTKGWCDQEKIHDALEWLLAAAEAGDAETQCNLGICFAKGWWINKDFSQARKWLSQSAQQEYADAQYTLGFCYFKGRVCKQNFLKAFKWINRAALKGHIHAQQFLDVLAATARGVTPYASSSCIKNKVGMLPRKKKYISKKRKYTVK